MNNDRDIRNYIVPNWATCDRLESMNDLTDSFEAPPVIFTRTAQRKFIECKPRNLTNDPLDFAVSSCIFSRDQSFACKILVGMVFIATMTTASFGNNFR